MDELARTAGFHAAHGIWSVSDGAALVPILAHVGADGAQGLDRLAFDDAAATGQAALEQGRDGWVRAVLVTDAYLHLDRGRVDALIVHAVEYVPSRRSLRMAVPYRPESSPGGFAVYRPKFIDVAGAGEPDYAALADHFFAGVDSHEHAAAVWNAHLLDESA
ncbi:hypothetical protein [Actinomadura verrucosospora]|uniref:Uncharacterized protein n=1 Tax=Actinomadura verrucosospora TaxID=46165 RepID=A0A7D3VUH3_ACTVE|nr:hypothetical protein [Actinomadura verrucosospora]QKG23239.1 hypothetical protein ACTIVE_4882 [Actinomadura verrucosospora]